MSGAVTGDGTGERVVVVGGGVVGLACAWFLGRTDAAVVVVDPGAETDRASWAAGGMLAPLSEAPDPGAFLSLAMDSLHRYPEFVRELEAVSESRVGLRLNGKLLTASEDDQVERLRRRFRWQEELGYPVEWMDGSAVREMEGALSPNVRAGLLLRGNGRVDNRRLVRALRRAAVARGARILEGRVRRVSSVSGAVDGVELTDGRRVRADGVILAAGAWSGGVQGLPRKLPVRPVRGQMLSLEVTRPLLDHVVTSPDVYVIPRETPSGPRIVLGATEEEAGFDLSVDVAPQEALHRSAIHLVPALAEAPVAERWAGLRPGTPDGLPVLGPDPELGGLCYATGHYRNGILLAPETAAVVSEWWRRGMPTESRDPFRVTRFQEG